MAGAEDEVLALRMLASPDEAAARRGFDILYLRARDPLISHVRRCFSAGSAVAEDVVQDVFNKVWLHRTRIEFATGAKWQRFLQVVAKNTYLDLPKSSDREEELKEESAVPPELTGDDAYGAVLDMAEIGLIKRIADSHWLGLETLESDDDRARRLLASQLYFLRQANFDQVIRLAIGGDPGCSADRCRLEQMLSDPATIRLLASRHLILSTDSTSAAVRTGTPPPFESMMAALLDALDRSPRPDVQALSSAGLWRRLIFEYGYIQELPHKEIVAWLGPPARFAGYMGVTSANVNVLMSANRLIGELREACRRALGEEYHD